MKPRRPRPLLISLSLALIAGLGIPSAGTMESPARAQEPTPPNVLVIVLDDMRAGLIRAMPKTAEWLHEGGTLYRHAFTPVPLCCPARASLFSGRYIHNHTVKKNRQVGKLDQETTMQYYLDQAGYRTGLVGKYFIAWGKEPLPYFDDYSRGKIGVEDRRTNYYGGTWNLNGEVRTVPTYSTEYTRRRSLRFLRRSEEQDDAAPWFLYAAPAAPHEPMLPENKYRDLEVAKWRPSPAIREKNRSDKPPWVREAPLSQKEGRSTRRRQIRTLKSVDDLVDSTMTWLQDNGELDNTLVVFTSDNGYMFGEHGLISKRNPYTESIAVPMLVRYPGHIEAGVSSERLVSLVDIAPTVLDAAGIDVPAERPMDGRSLLLPDVRKHVLIEFKRTDRTLGWYSLRSRRMQYIVHYGRDAKPTFREYYKLEDDRWQMINILHDGRPNNDPDVEELSRKLRRARACEGDDCP